MFVHYFTHVPLSVPEVEERLDLVKNRLADMADVAYREGEELHSKVGPWEGGFAKEVDLVIGTAEIHRTGIAYPITWTATNAELLFPSLKANLLLAHVGKHTTRIAFEGTYDPPLGPIGKLADRALLGRFAEATVRNWLDRLASSLTEAEFSPSESE